MEKYVLEELNSENCDYKTKTLEKILFFIKLQKQ